MSGNTHRILRAIGKPGWGLCQPETKQLTPMSDLETTIGNEIRHTESTGSTMDDMALLARDGVAEGLVLSTDEQTAGRGRYSRAWESEPGRDLLFSALFRPRPAVVGEINMLLALSIAEIVDAECGVNSVIKWPNDVRVRGAKISGILLESAQGAKGLSVVAGIGVNVNSSMRGRTPGGVEAVSMMELAGRKFDRDTVLKRLLAVVDGFYRDVRAGGTIVPVWKERLETLGQTVQVTFVTGGGEQKSITGVAEDVDEAGRLIVRDENGRAWPVAAGEVTLREDVR